MGDLLESRKRDSHDGNAGMQGPDPGEGDLAGDDAGKERGQNYRVREKRAVCRKCHADGHGHARDGRKAGKRNEACERIQGKEKLTQYRGAPLWSRSEEHTSELQSHSDLVCRLLLEKKKKRKRTSE